MKELFYTILFLTLVACGSSAARRKAPLPDNSSASMELQLPAVPATLRVPAERAAYVLLHFWDSLEFADTLRSCNKVFMEQNFANFLSLFPHASQPSLPMAVENLLARASVMPEAFTVINDIAENYLSAYDSPMRSCEYYIIYLQEYLRLPSITAPQRMRAESRLKVAQHNAQGSVAPDFTFTTREGKRTSLNAVASGKETLLLFYDPDCEHCMESVEVLRKNAQLNSRIADGKTVVVAVYPMGDTDYWGKTKAAMPSNWLVGCDYGAVLRGSLYLLNNMPATFLLDGERKVIYKEPTPCTLENYFSLNPL